MTNPDYFSDLLLAGESVVATIGGPGPAKQQMTGEHRSWYQLGMTETRLLVIRLVQPPLASRYQPTHRYAVTKQAVTISRFPKTPRSPARLHIIGAGEPIDLIGIDDPTIYPLVEPFLQAWGGAVGGGGQLHVAEHDPFDADARTDTRKLLIVVGVCLGMAAFCCGCSAFAAILRTLVLEAQTYFGV